MKSWLVLVMGSEMKKERMLQSQKVKHSTFRSMKYE